MAAVLFPHTHFSCIKISAEHVLVINTSLHFVNNE